MHAVTKQWGAMPRPVEATRAALAAIGGSLAWAFAMRRECERWTRRGHRLDGEAIRRIAERLDA